MSIELVKKHEGKIEIYPKIPVRSYNDFSLIYTPGVAEVSREIAKNKDKSFELTSRWNSVAIVTDGTRVLGLGNIGPEAALPVMEGKAVLFKYLGGVDAFPLPIRVRSAEDFVNVVKSIEPSFGGINLEDIESPKCFYILEKLQQTLDIPVWHDDQQGTAAAILAGLINSLIITNRNPKDSKVVLFGAGAANIATARVLSSYGFKLENMIIIDSKGPIYAEREDVDHFMYYHRWKYDLAVKTNKFDAKEIEDAFKDADIVIAASSPGPDVIKKKWIELMKRNPIVFALANPVPEILPQDAIDAGAEIVATGRSDFPNQVNNSLIFPGIFRGVLDSRSKKVTDEMIITASKTLAEYARAKGLRKDYIIPRMDEWEVYYKVAASVASKAVELGLARIKMSNEEFENIAKKRITRSRKIMSLIDFNS
jgi:malic enzyme